MGKVATVAIFLALTALITPGRAAESQKCNLRGEWQLTDAGTKQNGRVVFAVADGKLIGTYKGTGPSAIDQFRPWPLSRMYCDEDFITFQIAPWAEFWFFRKEVDRTGFKWVGRLRRNDDETVSEAVFFPLDQPR